MQKSLFCGKLEWGSKVEPILNVQQENHLFWKMVQALVEAVNYGVTIFMKIMSSALVLRFAILLVYQMWNNWEL